MENNEQQTTGCKSCKSNSPIKSPKGMMLIGTYILFATVYGTITFIKDIIHLLVK